MLGENVTGEKYKFIDAHCHLESIKDFGGLKKVLPVTVGYSHSSNIKNLAIAQKFKLPFALGIAPQTAIKEGIAGLDGWAKFIQNALPCPNAIGEIGLDYHWSKGEGDVQKEKAVFECMLGIADKMDLPIVIHSRKSETDVLDILEKKGFKKVMMHFFSGTLEEAKRALRLGYFISIPPIRSKERKQIIREIPLGKLLVETDSPYVAKSPEDVLRAVEYISEVKGVSFDDVARQAKENAAGFFSIKGL